MMTNLGKTGRLTQQRVVRLFTDASPPHALGNDCLDVTGPLQVVSGRIGRQRLNFEAPPADRLEAETSCLFDWLNGAANELALLKFGLGHPQFVAAHRFVDGN